VWHASENLAGRLASAAIAGATLLACVRLSRSSETLVIPALVVLLAATLIGVPVFVTLGGTALVLFWRLHEPVASISNDHYSLVTYPSLPTMPLFTRAGYFLAEGGAAKRQVRVFQAFFGPFRGGPAIVTALVCAFFTSFTGASGVTILALGGLLMPVLFDARYSDKDALGLLTGAGSLGLLLPPCLPMIVYAIVAKVPIDKMFLGGIIPALVMMTATALWGMRQGQQKADSAHSFNPKEALQALWGAKWELLMPVVASVALFSGLATPVEAAAITALHPYLVVTVFHREMSVCRVIPW